MELRCTLLTNNSACFNGSMCTDLLVASSLGSCKRNKKEKRSTRRREMASQQSLDLNERERTHYYHCVLANLPQELPIPNVAEIIVPQEQQPTPSIAELSGMNCRIIPHKLQTFKETMPQKFGFVTYFIGDNDHKSGVYSPEGAEGERAKKIHSLFIKWITEEHPAEVRKVMEQLTSAGNSQSEAKTEEKQEGEGSSSTTSAAAAAGSNLVPADAAAKVEVRIAQPPTAMSCFPFLDDMGARCGIISTANVKDVLKVQSFILTKVDFFDLGAPTSATAGDGDDGSSPGADVVASMKHTTVSVVELAWLRKEHSGFPEKANLETISAFFDANLKPLVYFRADE